MHDIKHSILIDTHPEVVYPLVGFPNGFSKWWASDVTEDKTSGTVELGFFSRATTYRLQPIQLVTPLQAHWLCQTGKEWSGTKLLFDLAENNGQTLLRFIHGDWQAETDYFVSCTTVWGELMFRIKATAEGKTPGPLFAGADVAY